MVYSEVICVSFRTDELLVPFFLIVWLILSGLRGVFIQHISEHLIENIDCVQWIPDHKCLLWEEGQ